jgi:nucleoside-diphosphate-sugar epimerase
MRQSAQERQEFQRENSDGTRFVAELAAHSGVRRVVFVSSIKVNGEGGKEAPYKASDTPDPQDDYARSKWLAEQMLRETCESNRIEWVIVRSPLVYGPGVKANFHRLMRLAHRQLPLPLASIRNRRSLVGISNLTDFLRTCVNRPAAAGRVWLVADDEALSTPDLLRRLAGFMHRRVRLFPMPESLLQLIAAPIGMRGEVDRLTSSLLVDATPARDELKWRPVRSVDEELRATVDRFMAEAGR